MNYIGVLLLFSFTLRIFIFIFDIVKKLFIVKQLNLYINKDSSLHAKENENEVDHIDDFDPHSNVTENEIDPVYHNNKGYDHFHKNEYGLAIDYFTKAITLKKDEDGYYSNRAIAYFDNDCFELAKKDWIKAYRLGCKLAPSYLKKLYSIIPAWYNETEAIDHSEYVYQTMLSVDESSVRNTQIDNFSIESLCYCNGSTLKVFLN